ncbi:MAG: BstYI [Thaumarchaeota archaeon]|nr:BstYI [Nitrososphaerota archaeon]
MNKEIYDVISSVVATKTKISKEKTMRGRRLYAPKDMNRQFRGQFGEKNFRELRDNYTITIPNSDVSIRGAYKQVDFVKKNVLVEVQFGKYAFMFYDMAKFQYFFNVNKADVGVEIVACHDLQKQMSSGVSYGEQLIYDIERLKRHFPAVPVKVILIDADLTQNLYCNQDLPSLVFYLQE